jgi:putative ABC transport system ATP-binding protein
MAIVEFKNVWKTYRMGETDVHALRDVSLSFEEGEYIAIMGASGSGKSTMLNLLGCLDRPTSGRYLLSGQDVSELPDDDLSEIRGARIGFIFQSYNLIDQLTVLDNIEIPLYYQGWAEKPGRDRAVAVAEKVGLADRLNHRPAELSGGQQQRVAIARALSSDPLILLGDEPTGNLDSATGREVLAILDGLSEGGKTVVIVTHDESVAQHAHRIIHLADGSVVKERRGGR